MSPPIVGLAALGLDVAQVCDSDAFAPGVCLGETSRPALTRQLGVTNPVFELVPKAVIAKALAELKGVPNVTQKRLLIRSAQDRIFASGLWKARREQHRIGAVASSRLDELDKPQRSQCRMEGYNALSRFILQATADAGSEHRSLLAFHLFLEMNDRHAIDLLNVRLNKLENFTDTITVEHTEQRHPVARAKVRRHFPVPTAGVGPIPLGSKQGRELPIEERAPRLAAGLLLLGRKHRQYVHIVDRVVPSEQASRAGKRKNFSKGAFDQPMGVLH